MKAENRETVSLKGMECHTSGKMVSVGSQAPDFHFVKSDLSESSLSEYKGKRVVLNIFPSLDTPVCAASVRHFNRDASSLENTVVLCVSMDLPFAHTRFCSTEGLENVVPASVFRSVDFNEGYGLVLADGPLKGLTSRAVIILDEAGKVVYTQLLENIGEEPDYGAAIAVLK